MAYSKVVLLGDGTTTTFAVNFAMDYLLESDVRCRVGEEVDGSGHPAYRNITFISTNLIQVQGTAPGVDVNVTFERTVDKEELRVQFSNGDVMDEENLDRMQRQMFMALHELLDGRTGDQTVDSNLHGYKIINLGDPTDEQDAVNKRWVETAMSSQLALAIAARTTAQTAASNAATSATNAATDASTVATDKATVAADKAIVIADKAIVAADKAIVAADKATTSGYKDAAAASASAASASQTAIAGAEAACAALLDSFDDRYLGPKAANPTLDNDGNALAEGQLYWNTVSKNMRVYDGSAWQVAYNPSLGSVDSVFGRTGAITASGGDYTAGLITNTPSGNLAASNVQSALNELQSDIDTRAVASTVTAALAGKADDAATTTALAGKIATSYLDTDTALAANSDTKIATQKAIKAYVDGAFTALKNGVSASFDTLKEIADWIATTGTAALKNTGTSGANVPLMSTTNAWSKQQNVAEFALTDGATVSWDCDNAVATWSVGGSRTLNTASNQVAGGIYTLQVTNSTGTAAIAFNSSLYKGVTGYVLTAGSGKVDELTFRSNGTVMRLIGVRQDIAG